LNHFTVPLAIHVVSAESKNKSGPPVPALTGTSASHKIPVCCELDSGKRHPDSGGKEPNPGAFAPFCLFHSHLTRCNRGGLEPF
jgi:hypothetical protein